MSFVVSEKRLQAMTTVELEMVPRFTAFSGCLMLVEPPKDGPRVRVDAEGRLLTLLDPYLGRPGVLDFLLRRLPLLPYGEVGEEKGYVWFNVDVPATPTAPYIWLRIYAPAGVFTQTLKQIQEMSNGKH